MSELPLNEIELDSYVGLVELHDPEIISNLIQQSRAAIRYREALISIAAYDDALANERLKSTNGTNYGGFDEPGSVQIARAALSSCEALAKQEKGE